VDAPDSEPAAAAVVVAAAAGDVAGVDADVAAAVELIVFCLIIVFSTNILDKSLRYT